MVGAVYPRASGPPFDGAAAVADPRMPVHAINIWRLFEPPIAHELREAIDVQPDSYQNTDEQVSAVAREWFRLLRTVEGVGAKAALAILSRCEPYELGYIIRRGDKEALMRASGVSPKVAKRIVTELEGQLPAPRAVGSRMVKILIQGSDSRN